MRNQPRDPKGRFIKRSMPMVGAWKLEMMQEQRDSYRKAYQREKRNGKISIIVWTAISFIAGTIFFMIISKSK